MPPSSSTFTPARVAFASTEVTSPRFDATADLPPCASWIGGFGAGIAGGSGGSAAADALALALGVAALDVVAEALAAGALLALAAWLGLVAGELGSEHAAPSINVANPTQAQRLIAALFNTGPRGSGAVGALGLGVAREIALIDLGNAAS
ncbi:MAG: hypothetical protein U0271_18410 [Polyangiaceae bacterium]